MCIYVLIYVNVFRDLIWFGFLLDFEYNWMYMLFLSYINVIFGLWELLKDFFFVVSECYVFIVLLFSCFLEFGGL